MGVSGLGTRYMAILLLIIASMSTISLAQQSIPVRPNISLRPEMTVNLFPDGSTSIDYNLSVLISNVKTNASGNIFVTATEVATPNTYDFNIGGGIDVKTLAPSKGNVTVTKLFIKSLFNIKSSKASKTLLVTGNATINIESKGNETYNYTDIYLDRIVLMGKGPHITLYVHAAIKGNATLPEKYVGELTSNITSELLKANITWINVSKLVVTKEDGGYTIELNGTLLLDKLVDEANSLGLLSGIEANDTLTCINKLYRDLHGNSKLVLSLNAVGNRLRKTGNAIAKFEAGVHLTGDISGLLETDPKCNYYISKLAYTIPLLIARTQKPGTIPPVMPGFMTPTIPNLKRKLPYKSYTSIDIVIKPDRVSINIRALTPRLTYIEDLGDPEKQLKATLRETSRWLQEINKQLSILALMGIPSPIPSTVRLKPIAEQGYTVEASTTETSIAGLAEVQVRVKSLSTEATTPTTSPLTPATVTVTSTETTTLTKTITVTQTETTTTTEYKTVTLEKTFTVTQQAVSIPAILAIAATIIIIAVIVAVIALVLRRR